MLVKENSEAIRKTGIICSKFGYSGLNGESMILE